MTRRDVLRSAGQGIAIAAMAGVASATEKKTIPTIPKVPGELAIDWRRREKSGDGFDVINETVRWKASETAIIICDMWSDHPCKMAAMRVNRMAPIMNKVVSLARDQGVAIIHAPSSGMKFYDETPYRQRMKQATYAKPPVPIQRWCYLNDKHEGSWPIVDDVKRDDANVTGCDDPVGAPHVPTNRPTSARCY